MSFTYYTPFTVDHTKVPSTQTNFPVLINITDNRFKASPTGHVQNSSGFDLRPYADTAHTSALTYQLEFYDGTAGTVVMWVLISSLSSAADTPIYLFYGDAALNTDGSSTSTWNANYKGVWNFPDGTTLSLADATAAGLNGTNHSATAAAGKVDGGVAFVGASTQYVDITGYTASTDFSNATFTVEMLFKSSTTGLLAMASKDGTGGTGGWAVYLSSGGIVVQTYAVGGVAASRGSVGTSYNNGAWHHLLVTITTNTTVVGSNTINIVVDGTADNGALTQTATYLASSGSVQFGRRPAGNYFTGTLDAIRISNVGRANDWAATSSANQLTPSTFDPAGTEVSLASGLALQSTIIRGWP